jgi:hypothetical protein
MKAGVEFFEYVGIQKVPYFKLSVSVQTTSDSDLTGQHYKYIVCQLLPNILLDDLIMCTVEELCRRCLSDIATEEWLMQINDLFDSLLNIAAWLLLAEEKL